MEIRLILRGALSGFIAGVLGFLFAFTFAEPLVDRAIDYESGRDDILAQLDQAVGRAVEPGGPEIFSRGVQSTIGIASGIVAFATAMGAIVAVIYVVLHGRFQVRPSRLVWMITAFGFFGVFLLPFVKYPANPPAIGHEFTITTRGHLYLIMVGVSIVLLAAAVVLARRLMQRFSATVAIVASAVAFLVVYGVVIGLLPSLGHLSANVAQSDQFGFARAATETPQPIVNVTNSAITLGGMTYAPGQLIYPGFDPDLLWKFRWYSVLEQLLVWTSIGLLFGALTERYLGTARSVAEPAVAEPTMAEPAMPEPTMAEPTRAPRP